MYTRCEIVIKRQLVILSVYTQINEKRNYGLKQLKIFEYFLYMCKQSLLCACVRVCVLKQSLLIDTIQQCFLFNCILR